MPLIISDETLQAAHLSKEEMLIEIALTLYADERFTLGQAAHFAGVSRIEFQRRAADRHIAIHYSHEELDEDQRTFAHLQSKYPHALPSPSSSSSQAL